MLNDPPDSTKLAKHGTLPIQHATFSISEARNMTANPAHGKVTIAAWHAYLLLAASVLTYLLITMGGIVCVTESGAACPDWPGCFGRAVPPLQVNSIIEYTHRFIAALTSPLILAAAVAGWWKARAIRWVSR